MRRFDSIWLVFYCLVGDVWFDENDVNLCNREICVVFGREFCDRQTMVFSLFHLPSSEKRNGDQHGNDRDDHLHSSRAERFAGALLQTISFRLRLVPDPSDLKCE